MLLQRPKGLPFVVPAMSWRDEYASWQRRVIGLEYIAARLIVKDEGSSHCGVPVHEDCKKCGRVRRGPLGPEGRDIYWKCRIDI